MEAAMSGIEGGNPEPIREESDQTPVPLGDSRDQRSEDVLSGFEVQVRNLLNLSAEMTNILSDLSRKSQLASDQLQVLRAEIDQKKQELKVLYEIEISALSLNQLKEEHRIQKENLERLIANQQTIREEEKEHFAMEEREYRENLGVARRREEEEYQHMRQTEQIAARENFEQELRIIQQKQTDLQAALEKDFLEREQILRRKEQDAVRLIQELERFMNKLVLRDKSQVPSPADLHIKTIPSAADSFTSSSYSPEGELAAQSPTPILASVNEMLLSLNKKSEALKDELSTKQESALLQFSFKKSISKLEGSESSNQS
jgi:hypothetical protein